MVCRKIGKKTGRCQIGDPPDGGGEAFWETAILNMTVRGTGLTETVNLEVENCQIALVKVYRLMHLHFKSVNKRKAPGSNPGLVFACLFSNSNFSHTIVFRNFCSATILDHSTQNLHI